MADRLAEIRGRLEAATDDRVMFIELHPLTGEYQIWSGAGVACVATVHRGVLPDETGWANAELFAHAPADIRYLLDEVERLRRSLDLCHGAIDEHEAELRRLDPDNDLLG